MPQCLPTKYWNPSAHSPLRRSHVSTGSSTSRRRPTCSHAWIECFQVEVSRSVLRWVREQDNSYPTVHGSWEHHRLNHALLEKDMLLPRRVFQSERDDSLYHSSANNKQMELNKQIYIYIWIFLDWPEDGGAKRKRRLFLMIDLIMPYLWDGKYVRGW